MKRLLCRLAYLAIVHMPSGFAFTRLGNALLPYAGTYAYTCALCGGRLSAQSWCDDCDGEMEHGWHL